MVKLMANLTGDNSISDKDIEYISDTMKQINLENQQYQQRYAEFLVFQTAGRKRMRIYTKQIL